MEAAGKVTLPILGHPLGGAIAVTPTGESAESSMGVIGPNREAAPAKSILDHSLGWTIAVTPTGESAESSKGVVGPNREASPANFFGGNTSKNHRRK